MSKKLSSDKVEELAMEIIDFLIKYRLWVDVRIFFNGKEISTNDPKTGRFFYNNKEHLVIIDNVEPVETMIMPEDREHILSMSFDSRLYEVLNYRVYEIHDGVLDVFHECDEFVDNLIDEFSEIFTKYGVFCYWDGSDLVCELDS